MPVTAFERPDHPEIQVVPRKRVSFRPESFDSGRFCLKRSVLYGTRTAQGV